MNVPYTDKIVQFLSGKQSVETVTDEIEMYKITCLKGHVTEIRIPRSLYGEGLEFPCDGDNCNLGYVLEKGKVIEIDRKRSKDPLPFISCHC